jgi:hypothetical protein
LCISTACYITAYKKTFQLVYEGEIRYAEVQYYCQLDNAAGTKTTAVAVVSLFSRPDAELYRKSFKTYRSCSKGNATDLVVIPVRAISTVVAMVPDVQRGPQYYYAVYKPGSTAGILTGDDERDVEES